MGSRRITKLVEANDLAYAKLSMVGGAQERAKPLVIAELLNLQMQQYNETRRPNLRVSLPNEQCAVSGVLDWIPFY